jgi:hypothetical protein
VATVIGPVHTTPFYFCKLHFNIIFPPTVSLFSGLSPSSFSFGAIAPIWALAYLQLVVRPLPVHKNRKTQIHKH